MLLYTFTWFVAIILGMIPKDSFVRSMLYVPELIGDQSEGERPLNQA